MNEFCFADIYIGQKESFLKTITAEAENSFREITGDINPLHYDDNFAAAIPGTNFKGHISFGMLTASLYSTLAGVYLPGKYSLIHSFDEISFMHPVYTGDELTVSGEVTKKWDELGLIMVNAFIREKKGETVSKAKIKIKVLK